MVNLMSINQLTTKNEINGDSVIEVYLNTLNADNTKRVYGKSIYEFFTYVYGDKQLTLNMFNVPPALAIKYTNYWKEQVSNGTIKISTFNTKIKGIKPFYDWLLNLTINNKTGERLLHVNPFATIKQMSEHDREGSEPLSSEDIENMLNHPYGTSPHIQERNLIMFEMAITTGIRNDALLGITLDNITTHADDVIVAVQGKENKIAKKPINNYYDRLLDWYEVDKKYRNKDNGTIFNLHPMSANRIIREWAKECGINKNITFHSLRTTTAVQIYHNTNGNLYKVLMALDHSDISTSKGYVRKENIINHDGENIIPLIQETSNIKDMLKELSKEQLVDLIMGMEKSEQFKIVQKLKGAE